ncbi:MAG: formate/nitrite transporter family protein [Lentisphaerae bacterium]|nr:formate/nitrite transporter family protein [Lentisphaerota bacterium]
MRFLTCCKTFINAIMAGLFIGLAGTVYLATPNGMLGAFLFAFGLMTILCYGFKLYTGAIGYLVTKKHNDFFPYIVTLILIWLGNLLGCWIVGTLVRYSRTYDKIAGKVNSICADKLADSPLSLLILSFFCGILMYLAVETYRRKELGKIFRFAAIFLCVSVFILSGFEHCIANMYYFSAANLWNINTLLTILLMTLGNSLGGWLLPCADKVR